MTDSARVNWLLEHADVSTGNEGMWLNSREDIDREMTKAGITERDPRVDPKPGDAVLTHNGAVVIGDVTSEGEVLHGAGDSRYWYYPLDKWREYCKDAEVLYVREA